MSKTYSEKLKDPRWQRKRLEVFNAADWKCEACGNAYETLHVHHKKYKRGKEPWEYESAELASLCETCHTSEHKPKLPVDESSGPCTPDGKPYPPERWFLSHADEEANFDVCPGLVLSFFSGMYGLVLWHENPPAMLGYAATAYDEAVRHANDAAKQLHGLCRYFYEGGVKHGKSGAK
jgi:hypothetical protein